VCVRACVQSCVSSPSFYETLCEQFVARSNTKHSERYYVNHHVPQIHFVFFLCNQKFFIFLLFILLFLKWPTQMMVAEFGCFCASAFTCPCKPVSFWELVYKVFSYFKCEADAICVYISFWPTHLHLCVWLDDKVYEHWRNLTSDTVFKRVKILVANVTWVTRSWYMSCSNKLQCRKLNLYHTGTGDLNPHTIELPAGLKLQG
jgi:hypothetical protein